MFTYYLIKVAWGGDARVYARVAINFMLRGCQNIGEVLLRKCQYTKISLYLLINLAISENSSNNSDFDKYTVVELHFQISQLKLFCSTLDGSVLLSPESVLWHWAIEVFPRNSINGCSYC
jgi:hypothetical protein